MNVSRANSPTFAILLLLAVWGGGVKCFIVFLFNFVLLFKDS
jgi:hypothetical protein